MTTSSDDIKKYDNKRAVMDPYALDPSHVMPAPTTMRDRLKYLGPGMITSAAVVGSGELITTTSLGAKAGFALLWLIVLSTLVKIWIQMELATYTILKGEPALQAYAKVPPRFKGIGWINALWFLMDFAKMFQRGGIIGGAAIACSLVWPIVGEPMSRPSLIAWLIVILAIIIPIVITNNYSILERVLFVIVVLFTLITAALALGLPLTEFSYTWSDIGSGFRFSIPAGALGIAISVFGITGVGADEMTSYTYWCVEKGYARYTGPDDGSEERAQRAEGWIKVMRLDLFVSWIICTVCTLSFYTMGAAVLHPQGLFPEGNDIIVVLSRMYTDTMGQWAYVLFMIASIAVLGSTFMASTASVPRLWANNLSVFHAFNWDNMKTRTMLIRIFTLIMPIIWTATFLGLKSPLLLVMIGGIGSAVFLLAVLVACWYLRMKHVERRFRSSIVINIMLVFSSIAILLLFVRSVLQLVGVL